MSDRPRHERIGLAIATALAIVPFVVVVALDVAAPDRLPDWGTCVPGVEVCLDMLPPVPPGWQLDVDPVPPPASPPAPNVSV